LILLVDIDTADGDAAAAATAAAIMDDMTIRILLYGDQDQSSIVALWKTRSRCRGSAPCAGSLGRLRFTP
jgi:hypothetical protein